MIKCIVHKLQVSYYKNMVDYNYKNSDNIDDAFSSLYKIVTFLRDPKHGCPWDREQTPETIIRSMQGEIYEYIDALSEKNKNHIKEELGDVFLNLFLLLKIHDQQGDFSAVSAINEACEKYIRRHPHVFADTTLHTSEEVVENWQKIKKEKEGRSEDKNDFFLNIPVGMPELERCLKISKKAAKVGFEWKDINGVYDKVNEELTESKNTTNSEEDLDEFGDVLFSVINLCRFKKINPSDALSHANRKFIKRFNKVYELAQKENLKLEDLSSEKWNDLWNQAKILTL